MSQTDEFLEHFGVMGMHWGVRKDETTGPFNRKRPLHKSDNSKVSKSKLEKQMRTDALQFRKEEREKAFKNVAPEQAKLEKQAMALAKKYNLDQDDGGGGDDTPEANAAGRKYMDLWEKHYQLEDHAWNEADKNVGKRLTDKYGKDKLADIKAYSKRKSVIKGTAIVASILALASLPTIIDLL